MLIKKDIYTLTAGFSRYIPEYVAPTFNKYPTPVEIDVAWADAEAVAAQHGVSVIGMTLNMITVITKEEV